jgi:hypothetical protein
MLRNVLRAFLVLHLETRLPAVTAGAVWAYWRSRPAIHFVIGQERQTRGDRIKRALDEVYPF